MLVIALSIFFIQSILLINQNKAHGLNLDMYAHTYPTSSSTGRQIQKVSPARVITALVENSLSSITCPLSSPHHSLLQKKIMQCQWWRVCVRVVGEVGVLLEMLSYMSCFHWRVMSDCGPSTEQLKWPMSVKLSQTFTCYLEKQLFYLQSKTNCIVTLFKYQSEDERRWRRRLTFGMKAWEMRTLLAPAESGLLKQPQRHSLSEELFWLETCTYLEVFRPYKYFEKSNI